MHRQLVLCGILALSLPLLPRISSADPAGKCIHTMTNCPGRGWVKTSCTDPHPCSGSSGGYSSSGSSGAYETGQAIGQALGQAIGDSIKRSREQAAIRAAQERQAAYERSVREAQEAAARQVLFEQQKAALLSATGSEGAGGLSPRDSSVDDSSGAQLNWLMRLHQREMDQRQAALAKLAGSPDENWCKLNLIHVRMPTPPLNDIAGQYPGMTLRYLDARDTWDNRCGGPSTQAGYRDNDSALMALRQQAPAAAAAAEPAPAPAPAAVAIAADSATVDLAGVNPDRAVASLKDGLAPAENLVNWGPPEALQLSLSAQGEAVAPTATAYIRNALDTLVDQGSGMLRETVRDAAGASLGMTGVVMVNATELPGLILPNIEAASRGELSVGEADRLLPRAVNTLYNTGSLSNEALEAALTHPDAMRGIQAWSGDKARGAMLDTVSDGIATFANLPEGTAALLSKQAESAINHWTASGAGASR